MRRQSRVTAGKDDDPNEEDNPYNRLLFGHRQGGRQVLREGPLERRCDKPTKDPDLVGLDDVLITRIDVQDRHSIGEAIEAGIARFGQIDALINNAGYGQ
jgi:NAD(P)-dependent dehydrogenase (short-subunit alcohol dehydrogenase family)